MNSERVDLTRALKAEAYRLGFAFAGITKPAPASHWQVYNDWLAAGRHAEMAYLADERARQRRHDPRQILAECRSILVLGAAYPASLEQPPAGKVAAYAWGDDYHEVLVERMQRLAAFLEGQIGRAFAYHYYTDTGPILERDLAQMAGLGWIGKNTCLIHPKFGSYFLLAEILLDLDLEADEPFAADRCGSCTRCLSACPTACILPDRTIDARGCISYLNIELKGAIPLELRTRLNGWVFGCDICQQVCPWNLRFARRQGDPAFAPGLDVPPVDLLEEIRLSRQGFNRKFKRSPVKRARRRGYLRNVAVVLGNAYADSANEDAVSRLGEVLLQEAEPLVRSHVAWALGRIGGMSSIQTLTQALATEIDLAVRDEIRSAILSRD